MTLRDLGDAALYIGAIAGAVLAIGALLRLLVVRPLKTWITSQAAPARDALAQVEPNGGSRESTRHLIEQTAEKVDAATGKLDEMTGYAVENREIATAALTLARQTSDRLDQHLTHHATPGGE